MDEIVARLPIHNHSGERLDVVLEPYGSEYHLRPAESLVIHTVGRSDGGSTWPGTVRGSDPFDVNYHSDVIQVYINGTAGWVTDLDGNELDSGHRRS